MSVANPPILTVHHRFTVEQYNRMIETGVLTQDDRVELLNGEIIDMTPIGNRHAVAVRCLLAHFSPLIQGRAVLSVQDPAILDDWSQPQPDLWLAKYRIDFYAGVGHPKPEDLLLVVEVADSSLKKDQRVKAPLYARAGVTELWIVDLNGQMLTIHRNPADGQYQSIETFKRPAKVACQAFGDLPLDLSLIFPA